MTASARREGRGHQLVAACDAHYVRLRAAAQRTPEWWAVALTGGTWLTILVGGGVRRFGANGSHHHPLAGVEAWSAALSAWLLMTVAMMTPLVLGAVRIAAHRSLWARRHRAIGLFLTGYLSLW